MTLRLYKLSRVVPAPLGTDAFHGFVVAAVSPAKARAAAAEYGRNRWVASDAEVVTSHVGVAGATVQPGVVLADYSPAPEAV